MWYLNYIQRASVIYERTINNICINERSKTKPPVYTNEKIVDVWYQKIQNHSVIFEWCDPYYVYILPIFPCEKVRNSMEIWRKILTKIYLLLRPEFLMIGTSKESKEGNSCYLDCFEKESQKGIGTLAYGGGKWGVKQIERGTGPQP